MGDSIQLIKHIELYVNSSATASQQAASVDAVAVLIKNDMLTLETLVREMEMYLTTTDIIIRSRGVLLLAESLALLASKPFSSTSIHSLIGFFTERLADWRALRGAIVGCLALLRRKADVGKVTDSEAKAVAQSYLQNLQVQSLGQQDRKVNPAELSTHGMLIRSLFWCNCGFGDNLVYGICEAIDGEKDPQCLLLVFHIVESLAQLYPGPSGPLANYAGDMFEILGSYFPIHFTHPKGDDDDIKREELSRALMLAFSSTPLFEPFCIPLLLEKLSSSLPSAKVESFRYLSYCTTKYGSDRMAKHAEAIWSSVKDITYISPQCTLTKESELMGRMGFQDNDIMTQAYILLQEVIQHYGDFISLIIGDNDINVFLNSLNQYEEVDDIPLQVKQRLYAVGRILSTCAKPSGELCNKVFESFFPLLMDGLGMSVAKPSENGYLDKNCFSPVKFNFAVIYLCVELLAACRYVAISLNTPDFSHQTWCIMLSNFSQSLVMAFFSLLRSDVADDALSSNIHFGVKGLQNLATFPERFPSVSKSIYNNILLEFVSIITSESNKTFLWTSTLKALAEIGSFVAKCPESEKAASFEIIVVKKIVSLIASDDSAMPLSLKLQAAFEIGATKKDFMLRVVRGLDEAIYTKLSAAYDHGNYKSVGVMVQLLDTYSQKVLPWFLEIGGHEEIPLNFTLSIWEMIENSKSLNLSSPEIASNLLGAIMAAMKKAVGSCSKESQEIIINKASGVFSSSTGFGSMLIKSGCSTIKEEGLQQTHKFGNSSNRDEWITSLFASVVVALHPQTSIPNGKMIMQMFIKSLLNGHVPSAHALGSLVNKLPLEIKGMDSSRSLSLNEALDMIFSNLTGSPPFDNTSGNNGSGINFNSLRLNTLRMQSVTNRVVGLAWIGKGLLMRGHENVKDITMALLSFLTLDHVVGDSKELRNLIEGLDEEDVHQLRMCAADAFHIIMSDSGECLNRMYHATIRPLYKQRLFSTIMPIFLSLVVKSESSSARYMLYRAFAHIISDTPMTAILGEAKKLVPILLDCLSMLSKDAVNKEIIYNILLVMSGVLLEENGRQVAVENVPSIIDQLIELTTYSHMMVQAIRETALQCLVAVSQLPHTRVYPLRAKVLRATSKTLDDPKRIVRREAVRCRQAWASIASRSLHF